MTFQQVEYETEILRISLPDGERLAATVTLTWS